MKNYLNSVFVENDNIIFSRTDFIVELKNFLQEVRMVLQEKEKFM